MTPAIGRILVPALLTASLLAGCSGATDKAALPERTAGATVGVRVVQPSSQLSGDLVKATGKLIARNEAQIGPKASGMIAQLFVDVGDEVKKGDAMLRLDATSAAIGVEQAKAAVAVAEASLQVATQDLDRARSLRASGGVSPAGLEKADAGFKQADANLKQARAALRNAEKHLADHTLRAPFDGTVTARHKNVGEYVSTMPATPVFGLVDGSSIEVVLPVPETVIGAVAPGTIVKGVVNPSRSPFEAKVRTVGTVVSAARTVEVRADLVGERTVSMRPNAIVEVDFSSDAPAADGFFLPAQAIRREGESRFVWVVADGKVIRKDVEAQALTPGFYKVGGIDGSAQVVADDGVSLTEGMAVQVLR